MRTKTRKKNKINVITLGCSKNVYDSEVLMRQLKANNKDVVHEEEGNVVVINTCGFIDNAKEQSVNTILDAVKQKDAVPDIKQFSLTINIWSTGYGRPVYGSILISPSADSCPCRVDPAGPVHINES